MATMNDGILCWSYTGVRNKTYCRILWIVWLCLMLLLFACTGITTAVITLPDEMKQILTRISLCLGGVVTAIFALIWLWESFLPKKYSYSANEKELTVAYGRYTNGSNRCKSSSYGLKGYFQIIAAFLAAEREASLWNSSTIVAEIITSRTSD